VMMDSLTGFHSLDENKSKDMALLMRDKLRTMASRLDATILPSHHVSKYSQFRPGAKGKPGTQRGSSELRNGPDLTLLIDRDKTGVSVLRVDKFRNLSDEEVPPPLAIKIVGDTETGLKLTSGDDPGGTAGPKMAKALADLRRLKEDGLAYSALLKALPGLRAGEYSERTAKDAIAVAKGNHFAVRDGRYYRIPCDN
jgi:hypothetical protein